MNEVNKIGWKTAMAVVVASMIGTGVFTSLGYQLADIQNTWSIIIMWTLGGVVGLIGAFIYAELGTHFPESGGDYVFLSKIFHPFAGYLYAWVSLTVGFSAPISVATLAMVDYMQPVSGDVFNKSVAIGIVLIITLVHSFSVRNSGKFQNVSTILKVFFILVLISIGFAVSSYQDSALNWDNSWTKEILLPGYAVALIFTTWAYTGWNSAAYLVGEIKNPLKNLPKALIYGTALVAVLYVLMQVVFLKHASVIQLENKSEVASISFANILGISGVKWVSAFIALQLIATISSYLWIGSRITFAMAKNHSLWKPINKLNSSGIPVRALWLQTIISIILTLTGTFKTVLLYAGFTLQLMGTLTIVSSLFLKNSRGFKTPFKPIPQIIFILFSLWVLIFMIKEQPKESIYGLSIIALGAITYFISKYITVIADRSQKQA